MVLDRKGPDEAKRDEANGETWEAVNRRRTTPFANPKEGRWV